MKYLKKIKNEELVVEDPQVVESFEKWARIFQSKVFTLCQLEHIDPYDVEWWDVWVKKRAISSPMEKYLRDLVKSVQGDGDLGLSVLSQIPDEALNEFVSERFVRYIDEFHRGLGRQSKPEPFWVHLFGFLFILGLWWIIFELGFFDR